MKHYFVIGEHHGYLEFLEGTGASALISFYYLRQEGLPILDLCEEAGIPLFLDSGAFTAKLRKEELPVEDYADFCLEHGHRFEIIASLDVIGDWKASAQNHDFMLEAGVPRDRLLPAFHPNEPFEELTRLATENPYIALGGIALVTSQPKRAAWVGKCFKCAQAVRPEILVHGFGVTSSAMMRRFSWASVDSTTWLAGSKYGRIYVITPTGDLRLISSRDMAEQINRTRTVKLGNPKLGTQGTGSYKTALRHNVETIQEWVGILNEQRERGRARAS